MHPTILNITGYILLLSSLITLMILLQKGCKHKIKLSFYILSVSDVISTILMATILVVNGMGIKLDYNWENNTNNVLNYTWIFNDKEIYEPLFLQTCNIHNDEIDFNITLICGIQNIFMQYGILLAPLTNAFISLLTFAIQCNFNTTCIKRNYAKVIGLTVNDIRLENRSAEIKKRDASKDDEENLAFRREDNIIVNNTENVVQEIVKNVRFHTIRKVDDKKLAYLLVTSHWLVPFLIVGILYFAELNVHMYDKDIIRQTEDTECVFNINFPMNSYHLFSNIEDNSKTVDSSIYVSSLENDYLTDKDLNNLNPNDTEIDQIIMKVQNIVSAALYNIHNSTENTKIVNFFNSSGLQNATRHIKPNNSINYFENGTKSTIVSQKINDRLTIQNMDIHNLSSKIYNDIYSNQNPELSLFHDLLKDISKDLNETIFDSLNDTKPLAIKNNNSSYQTIAQLYSSNKKENIAHRSIDDILTQWERQNVTSTSSSSEIHPNMMKYIQASIGHDENHHNPLMNQRNNDKGQSRKNNLKSYTTELSNFMEDLYLKKSNNINQSINLKINDNLLYMSRIYLVSSKFLRSYLFILFFVIYLLPILFSYIIQAQGKYRCKNILAMLQTNAEFTSTLSHNNIDSTENNMVVDIVDGSLNVQIPSSETKPTESIEEFNTSQEMNNDKSSVMDIEKTSKINENDMKTQNTDMILEIDCISRISRAITLSLIICVILWTPIFLGILLRVFICINAPQWFIDITYLSAISFGVLRNILNLNIIKIQQFSNNARTKKNSVQPVK